MIKNYIKKHNKKHLKFFEGIKNPKGSLNWFNESKLIKN